MGIRIPTWQECKDALPIVDKSTPQKIVDRAKWAVPVCFYSWATYETAKATATAAGKTCLTCLKNPDTKLISYFVSKDTIFALKDSLGCIDQSGFTLALLAVSGACLAVAVYSVKKMAAKQTDPRLILAPNPPGESPRAKKS